MTVGQRVKQLRLKNGLTQLQVAEMLGMGRSNYGHIENDRVELESEYATILANKFNTTSDYILMGDEDETFDPDIRSLQRAAKKMSPEERKKAIKILNATFEDLFDDED